MVQVFPAGILRVFCMRTPGLPACVPGPRAGSPHTVSALLSRPVRGVAWYWRCPPLLLCGIATGAAALGPPPGDLSLVQGGGQGGSGRGCSALASRPNSPRVLAWGQFAPFPGRPVGARSVRPGDATRGETEARVRRGGRERCARCRQSGLDACVAVLVSIRGEKGVAHTDLIKRSSGKDGVMSRCHGDSSPRISQTRTGQVFRHRGCWRLLTVWFSHCLANSCFMQGCPGGAEEPGTQGPRPCDFMFQKQSRAKKPGRIINRSLKSSREMRLSTGCCGNTWPRELSGSSGAREAFLRQPRGEGEMEVVLVFMAFKKKKTT